MGESTIERIVKPDGGIHKIMIGPLLAPTNSVPAVAARQRGQVLFCLNGRKGCVGCGLAAKKNCKFFAVSVPYESS